MLQAMGRRSSSSFRANPIGALMGWIPMAVALCLFYQVYGLGLRSAIDEEQRLIEAQAELETRYVQAQAASVELERILRAQEDPMYLERERRKLLSPGPLASAAD